MFLGRFEASVDASGRVVLPKAFRRVLPPEAESAGLILAARRGGACLELRTREVWGRWVDALGPPGVPGDEARAAMLVDLLALACEVHLDRRGRLVLPDALRERAGIGSAVVLVGLSERIQLWSRDRWNEIAARRDREAPVLPTTGSVADPDVPGLAPAGPAP